MTNVPKLKLSVWQELIYFLFVIVIPTIIVALELFSSHSSIFKITFASVGTLLIVLIVLKKFVLRNYIAKLQERIIMLEHDYEISNGEPKQIEAQWSKFNVIIFAYSAFQVILSLVLSVIFVNAISEGLIAFRGASIIILASVIVGLIWKAILFVIRLVK